MLESKNVFRILWDSVNDEFIFHLEEIIMLRRY